MQHVARIDTELSKPDYDDRHAEEKGYEKEEDLEEQEDKQEKWEEKEKGEEEEEEEEKEDEKREDEKREEEEEEISDANLNEIIREILFSPTLCKDMPSEKESEQYEEIDAENLHAIIQEILSIPDDDMHKGKTTNVTPGSTSDSFTTSHDFLPPLPPRKRVRFALSCEVFTI